jgi:phosphoglycolate phosphatase
MKSTTTRFSLLVFDWDGTIADSLQPIVNSISYAIAKLGLPEKPEQAIKGIIGLGLEEALQRLCPGINDQQSRSMASYYREHYLSSTANNIRLYPGAAEIIKSLHKNGHELAVATGKSRRGLDKALQESGLNDFFHYSRCADETFSKPHPQMLEDIMGIFQTPPERVLMIGDSEHDLQMAKNAGICSAAVTYGAQDKEYLLKFEPLTCFNSLTELPQWLAHRKQINTQVQLSK